MSLKKCFAEGLLKRVPFEKERVESSLSLSAHYLERAKGNLTLEYWDVAFLMAYNSMLQAARAILFKDGIKERSHYCCVEYLRDKCAGGELASFVELLDTYRQNRHAAQYEGETVSEKEARTAVKDAQKFIDFAKKEAVKK